MQIIYDYLSGNVSGQEFIRVARADDHIPLWFQSLIPAGADIIDKPFIPYHYENGVTVYQRASSSHPFWNDVYNGLCLNVLHDRIDFREYFRLTRDFNTAGGRLEAYTFLLSLTRKAYPDIKESRRFTDEYSFYLDVCGEYTDGSEVEQYADDIVFEVYNSNYNKTERKRIAKQRIKEAFHITDRCYPRWIQGAEWPMGENSPMEYISRKRSGECVTFTFRDVDTGEIREIEQFY